MRARASTSVSGKSSPSKNRSPARGVLPGKGGIKRNPELARIYRDHQDKNYLEYLNDFEEQQAQLLSTYQVSQMSTARAIENQMTPKLNHMDEEGGDMQEAANMIMMPAEELEKLKALLSITATTVM